MDTKNISDLPVSLDFLPYTYLIAECRLCCFAAEENLGRRDRRKTLLSLVFLKNNTCRSDFLEHLSYYNSQWGLGLLELLAVSNLQHAWMDMHGSA